MALHIGIGCLYRLDMLEGADKRRRFLFIDWNDVKVISAITTFFVVFYTNTTFGRYMHLYTFTRKLIGLVTEFCFETSLHVKSTATQHVRLSARWLTAATSLYLLERTGKSQDEVWRFLREQRLIKADEQKFFTSNFHRGQRAVVLMNLAAKVIRDGHNLATTAKKAPANALKGMVEKLVTARRCMLEIDETLALPIPFQYFHLLNMMIVVNLLLWAYGMGITDSFFAPIVYFFAALIFMGMMELASQLSDPFGEDDTDFPTERWIDELMDDVSVITEYQFDQWDEILKMEPPLASGGKVAHDFLD
jgi:predicted membrane chloride channel (bestrophin family)